MDIEGGELDAIQGGMELLIKHKPHLIIEVHSRDLQSECDQLLKNIGYQPKKVSPRKIWREIRPDDYNGWLVCRGKNNIKNYLQSPDPSFKSI